MARRQAIKSNGHSADRSRSSHTRSSSRRRPVGRPVGPSSPRRRLGEERGRASSRPPRRRYRRLVSATHPPARVTCQPLRASATSRSLRGGRNSARILVEGQIWRMEFHGEIRGSLKREGKRKLYFLINFKLLSTPREKILVLCEYAG